MDTFVQSLMQNLGVFGIALLMFLENIFPPIPSELIMPLAGYQAASGEHSLVAVILAGTAGALVGILPWYYLGRAFGEKRIVALADRFGRWLTMTAEDVEAADRWFRRYGIWAVFLGRLVPTVRTLISVPAGLSRMPLPTFLLFSALGTLIWTTGLTMAGYLLASQYERVNDYVGPVSNIVIAAVVVLYLYRVITFKPRPRSRPIDLQSDEMGDHRA
ncbi:DedA family protein [Aureimonas jatrophae]|uniref:Membrane protein DedA, SNARE-associated domain n=1 Tax=Aureimonas jatrophae TaxID=1166073 RepID=A0A1H0CBT8_9HYPH|nr:DedA family protein [Aureimonas jatrophae]MBB3949163.1 membrane protein DedA with SNARE-associated domain [Aureimonas jatrophae]SDN55350.1 membrane protein DedA, SNARE-associated domain [Aureimonas jatrophae]